MSRSIRFAAAAFAVLALNAPILSAQQLAGPRSTVVPPAPVALDTTGMFLAKYFRVGDDLFIGGQPTERALRELRAQGVTTIVNLRTPPEMTRDVPFDEAELARSLGMRYVYIPMRGNEEYPYSPEALATFTAAMKGATGKVLLHCTIAWRASHLYAAYLIQERNVPVATALEQARAINLMDAHRMDGARQPLEQFLARPVEGLGRPQGH
jgi:protein tyrosine phosphatase (PTP) superfamily phosphohydrolase (DUF442 family)